MCCAASPWARSPTSPRRSTDADAAIGRALDLSAPAATPPAIAPPPDYDTAQAPGALEQPVTFWLQQMQSSPRLLEERLVWFWHDHFASSVAKVRIPYLMWQQHLLLRQHATGNFADLLHAVSKDPAMLWYLDGVTNTVRARNENFGREVMELFTLGRGNYTEQDVVEASRAFTGWAVNILGLPQSAALSAVVPPWNATFLAARHDNGTKTLLGTTAQPRPRRRARRVAEPRRHRAAYRGKLYTELVGVAPSAKTANRLGNTFRDQNYAVMPLVEAIVAEPAFTSEGAVGVKTRSPIEKLVGIVQAIPPTNFEVGRLGRRVLHGRASGVADALRTLGYVPFVPPNVAGYPKGIAPRRSAPARARVRPAVGVPERTGDPGPARRPARPVRARRRERPHARRARARIRPHPPARPRGRVARVRGGVTVATNFDLDHEFSRRKFLAGLGLAGTVVAGSYALDTWARPIAGRRGVDRAEGRGQDRATRSSSSSWPAATTGSAP